ncbi:MAG: PIN domain-containing protein [Muribaculaceae bacterium]|nr:PIN domain-containing protein [Roseburia sp.]MCM1431480.1 PIN domain-containing protein [Muribaculaceae bacterium]MCM1493226.1 PIN domain-containing protein [Muribaculaceae bacterium]
MQKNDLFYSKMRLFWKKYMDCDYITSAITVTEYLTYPYSQNDSKMIGDFYAFLLGMDIEISSIDREIAEKAAEIRAGYHGFKAMDALQLATACITGCDLFLTNDKQLRQFKEIRCITVAEWEDYPQ